MKFLAFEDFEMKTNHELEYSISCICLKNLIAILIFVYFSIYFQIWWLVFISLLFQTGVHTLLEDMLLSRKSTSVSNFISCDVCGEILYVADVQNAVHGEMKDHNWVRVEVHGQWKNVCSHCAKKYLLKRQK